MPGNYDGVAYARKDSVLQVMVGLGQSHKNMKNDTDRMDFIFERKDLL